MTKGFYGGATVGLPVLGGFGGGLYFDNHGNFYPQVYYGTPGGGISTGYSPDLEGFLTGTSVSGNFGSGSIKYNIGTSGSSSGVGFGTPGVGVTYGFGPYKSDPAPPDAAGGVDSAIYSTGFALLPSDGQEPFGDRFGKWESSPVGITPQTAANRPQSFDNRFGNWVLSRQAMPTTDFRRKERPQQHPRFSRTRSIRQTAISLEIFRAFLLLRRHRRPQHLTRPNLTMVPGRLSTFPLSRRALRVF
jgi:hypothetical protein